MSTFCRRSCEFQSTLPHGSDRERTQRHAAHGISIHAPSRERQGLLQLLAIGAGISIHAPSRERHYSAGSAVCCIYFNPRSLPGATGFGKSIPLPARISIHAPSRERLLQLATSCPEVAISIHAPSRERPPAPRRQSSVQIFQSTLPRGSDVRRVAGVSNVNYFNPRSLAGATRSNQFYRHYGGISIHAPSRERPIRQKTVRPATPISIHAPSRERLHLTLASSYVNVIFQSTLPRGSDAKYQASARMYCDFNPRSLAGATIRRRKPPTICAISIHAPSRERLMPRSPSIFLMVISIHAPSRERLR